MSRLGDMIDQVRESVDKFHSGLTEEVQTPGKKVEPTLEQSGVSDVTQSTIGEKDYRDLAERAVLVKHLRQKGKLTEKEKEFIAQVEGVGLTDEERIKVKEEIDKVLSEGKKKPGERDGTGPASGSYQDKTKGVGKRKEKGEKCPEEEKKAKAKKEKEDKEAKAKKEKEDKEAKAKKEKEDKEAKAKKEKEVKK